MSTSQEYAVFSCGTCYQITVGKLEGKATLGEDQAADGKLKWILQKHTGGCELDSADFTDNNRRVYGADISRLV
jgi:hypothetical protein